MGRDRRRPCGQVADDEPGDQPRPREIDLIGAGLLTAGVTMVMPALWLMVGLAMTMLS